MWHVTHQGADISTTQRFITVSNTSKPLSVPVQTTAAGNGALPNAGQLVSTRVVERRCQDGVATWRCSCRKLTTHKYFCRHIYCAWLFQVSKGRDTDACELLSLIDARWLRVSTNEMWAILSDRSAQASGGVAVVGRTGSARTKLPRNKCLLVHSGPDEADDTWCELANTLSQHWQSLARALRSPGFPDGQRGTQVLQEVSKMHIPQRLWS